LSTEREGQEREKGDEKRDGEERKKREVEIKETSERRIHETDLLCYTCERANSFLQYHVKNIHNFKRGISLETKG
jgi:hypothetical protein